MNWRNPVYLSYARLRGYRFPALFAQYRQEYVRGVTAETVNRALQRLLRHCRRSVPYYAERLGPVEDQDEDPRERLALLPLLTKPLIRSHFERLQSVDLARRSWFINSSGGSTGEPVPLVQDAAYSDRSAAISLLHNWLLGHEIGLPLVRLWGSERDLEQRRSPKARFFDWLTNTTLLNAFRMSPERMREFILVLNRIRPSLIVAYAQAIYELARFAEREGLAVAQQRAILTSAGTLHPFMRDKIAAVFGCEVYNLYGSREVSAIGCEVPGCDGLWVAPWSNYVEILDEQGAPVPPGQTGNIVVTCLTNYAMPLIRYWIGDRGALLPDGLAAPPGIQVLKQVSGRTVDVFRTRDQTLVDGEYFTHLLYFRPWVWQFQVVQKDPARVVFKIVTTEHQPRALELEEIIAKTRLVMGGDCQVEFEFPHELPPHPSGKYRYTISEVAA